MRMKLFLVAILVTCSCSGVSTVGPTEVPGWVRTEWAIGQCRVSSLVPPPSGNPYAVDPDGYRFIEESGPFRCGDVQANGCYNPMARTIRYNVLTPAVMRHEAGHAILRALADSRALVFEHVNDANDKNYPTTMPQPPAVCQ